jgi:hypothetical protein
VNTRRLPRARSNLCYKRGKLFRRRDGRTGTPRNDRTRNFSRLWLFTKLTKECGEFWNRQVRKKRRSALPLSGVEAKVKRSASANAKAALTIYKLIRRETEVKEDAIDAVKTSGRGGLSNSRAASVERLQSCAILGESRR